LQYNQTEVTMAKQIKLKELDTNVGAEKMEITGLEAVVPQIRKIDTDIEALAKQREDLRGIIMNKVGPIMKDGLSKGHLVKSYIVKSEDGQPATVLYKNAYSKLDPSNEQSMKEFLGDMFSMFFSVQTSDASLKKNANTNELRKLLGDRFSEFFSETKSIDFTKDFMEKRASLHDQLKAPVRGQLDKWMGDHQAKPDLRMKG